MENSWTLTDKSWQMNWTLMGINGKICEVNRNMMEHMQKINGKLMENYNVDFQIHIKGDQGPQDLTPNLGGSLSTSSRRQKTAVLETILDWGKGWGRPKVPENCT